LSLVSRTLYSNKWSQYQYSSGDMCRILCHCGGHDAADRSLLQIAWLQREGDRWPQRVPGNRVQESDAVDHHVTASYLVECIYGYVVDTVHCFFRLIGADFP
jgi:hypothetical protein